MMRDCEIEQEGDGGLMYQCPAQAVGKWRGHWYCSEHLDDQMRFEDAALTDVPMRESDTFL